MLKTVLCRRHTGDYILGGEDTRQSGRNYYDPRHVIFFENIEKLIGEVTL